MAARPSAELVAEWYARLPPGMDIERPGGRLQEANPGGRMLGLNAEGAPVTNGIHSQWTRGKLVPIHMAPDASRRMVSYAHAQLGAASWRMPRVTNVPDLRGLGRGAFRRRLTLKRQRRILRLLADGATVRQVAKATRTNFTVIAHVRKAALAWKDPDDE